MILSYAKLRAMPHIDRDGVSVSYDTAGSGPTVLLSHGYSATARMWDGQVAPLTDAGFQVVRWDMRGHGDTDAPEADDAYSEALTVGDMAAILDAVGADSAVIGGLSLGGYMSLAFHLAHPARVRALLLFDTGPGFRKDDAREQWNAMAEKTAGRVSPGLARAARGMLVQHDARILESLATIAVPTLVLVGEHDTRFHAGTDYMAAKIPGATKVVIPDAGHEANVDQPAAFNAAVLDFLTGL